MCLVISDKDTNFVLKKFEEAKKKDIEKFIKNYNKDRDPLLF